MKPFTIAGKALSCIYLMLSGTRMLSEIYALDSKKIIAENEDPKITRIS
jgi:hypothetical protein